MLNENKIIKVCVVIKVHATKHNAILQNKYIVLSTNIKFNEHSE